MARLIPGVISYTAMKEKKSQEHVKLWRLPELGNVELMHAHYVTQSFPRHTHEGFGVGVIERGALGFYYRGRNVVAPPGVINLVNPGEVHTGHAAAAEGWTYRMFYFGADLLQKAATQITGGRENIPFFRGGVIHDQELAGMIHSLHVNLEENKSSLLEKESSFLLMLTRLIARHSDAPPACRPAGREHLPIKRAKDFIESHFHENISIEKLSSVASLSPFHFIRAFRNEVGLPPHAYLTQVRVRKAMGFLKTGRKIADTAYETGFADQSHLSRHFKRITGYTPGQYSNSIQDFRKSVG
jgi:AraC-like DNA-binding protein